jgi:hypothetical protein
MERVEVLRQMIAEYRKKITTYELMIAEWEGELRMHPSAPGATHQTESPKAKTSGTSDIPLMVRNFQFYGKTQTDASKTLLEMVGHPLTTEEIMEGIEKGGLKLGGKTAKDKKQNFYTILYRSKEFGRAAKNTWGLMTWPGISKSDPGDSGEDSKKDKSE